MLRPHQASRIAVLTTLAILSVHTASAQHKPTIEQYLKPGYPQELVSARKADRIAWESYEAGRRNIYEASAPDFKPRRLTSFLDDDGIDLTDVRISDDGNVVAFVRGTPPNRSGWVANPTGDPNGGEHSIWAVNRAGGAHRLVADAANPVLSPNGKWVLFVKEGQIYRVATAQTAQTPAMDKGEKPFIKEWGTNGNPKWSPDGSMIAFTTNRADHGFVGIYNVKKRAVTYMSPNVDFDTAPTWSGDGKRIAFIRRPGTPFGQQSQTGLGGIGNPSGPAFNATAAPSGGNGRGGGGAVVPAGANTAQVPGLYRGLFDGGYNLSFWVGDPVTGLAHELWHNAPNERDFNNINTIQWAGDALIFQLEPHEWVRYYSVSTRTPAAQPIELTPGEGQLEHTGLSADGQTLFYSSNVNAIDSRHIWKVPTAGGTAEQISTGDIQTYPVALASGKQVTMLTASWNRPQSVGVMSVAGGPEKVIYPTLTKEFPADRHVQPTNVMLKAADGNEFHNQLFLPKDMKAGEKRPAIIFVHGGPQRQMLLGYHYLSFYHVFYSVNEWLVDQGYIVMSVNYRSGIGYGKAFRNAPNTGARGNSEYQDVLAAGKYLQSRPDVDASRVGIWGLSYGGLLTAEALARNSDIFVTGVDLAGVHLEGSSLDSTNVGYKSSAISAIEGWKSPVLLVQGDDDRNVAFSQMVGLVSLLRAHHVTYDLTVLTDDVHETLLHRRWLDFFGKMESWLDKYLKHAGGK